MSGRTRSQQKAMFARMKGRLLKRTPQSGERKSISLDREYKAKGAGKRCWENLLGN